MNSVDTTRLDEDKIDSSVNSVHQTKDYDKFKFDPKNREINPAHLDKLKDSIEENNLLEGQPILVNEDFEIIDGQHRFYAAKEKDLPIYYIKKDGLTIDDAITLNINTRNWRYNDYMWHWIERGKEEYVYFHQFMEKYGFGYSVSLALLGLGQADRGQKLTDNFNEGKFTPKYKDYAEEMGQKTQQLKKHGEFVTTKTFMLAFDQAHNVDEFEYQELVGKIEQVPDRFKRCSTQENYLLMLEKVYNYNRKGDRVRLY